LEGNYDDNLNELINMVKRSPELPGDAGLTSDRTNFEAVLNNANHIVR